MEKIIQIRLGAYRPVFSFDSNEVVCNRDDVVILEIERGQEFGVVISEANKTCKGKLDAAEGKVLRLATPDDLKQIEASKLKA